MDRINGLKGITTNNLPSKSCLSNDERICKAVAVWQVALILYYNVTKEKQLHPLIYQGLQHILLLKSVLLKHPVHIVIGDHQFLDITASCCISIDITFGI